MGVEADGVMPAEWRPPTTAASVATALIAGIVLLLWCVNFRKRTADDGGTRDESDEGSGGLNRDKRLRTCYYALLGNLDRGCGADVIKAAYRKLALQLHPDKAHLSGLSMDEATERFQELQEAYATLSDPQARAYYDSHREEILKGFQGSDGGCQDESSEAMRRASFIDLSPFLDESCFRGFGDDSKGFFQVYNEVFAFIDEEEQAWDVDNSHESLPGLGYSMWSWELVGGFYERWTRFSSKKAFSFADRHKLREAPNRQARRAMEQENRKLRQAARSEFNSAVRELVQFVKRRDPRVKAHETWKAKEKTEKLRRQAEDQERRKAAETEERAQRRLAARAEEEQRWRAYEEERVNRRKLGGGEASSDEGEGRKESSGIEYCCKPCKKSYNSENAYKQHLRSKKHKATLAFLGVREVDAEVCEDDAPAEAARAVEGDAAVEADESNASLT